MGLVDALFLDSSQFNIFIAARTDAPGTGSAHDPLSGAAHLSTSIPIRLARGSSPPTDREATVDTSPLRHGLQNGDMVLISGVSGLDSALWNGTFGIYGVTDFSFKYFMKKAPAPDIGGNPICQGLSFP